MSFRFFPPTTLSAAPIYRRLLLREWVTQYRFVGLVVILMAWIGLSIERPAYAVDWDKRNSEFTNSVLPILKVACMECHSGPEADGGLALNHFKSAKMVMKERATWEKIITRLTIKDMPPPEAEPLNDAKRQQLIDWINVTINDVECGKTPNPGSITIRRLNKHEYRNTIRDLFGVDYEPAVDFPGDDVGYGFDNIGDVLTMPPLLMEKYLKAAEDITRKAILAPEPGPMFENSHKLSELKPKAGGAATDSEITLWSNGDFEWDETVPWSGTYYLNMLMGGSRVGNMGPRVLISVDGKKVRELDVKATPDTRDDYQIMMKLKGGKRSISVAFTNDATEDGKNGKPAEDRNLYIYSVGISGQKPSESVDSSTLPASHTRIITAVPSATLGPEESLKKVLGNVARRIYRRPISPAEVDRFVKLSTSVMEEGESYEGAVQVAIQAMLVSPYFVFKVESPQAKTSEGYPLVNEFELASRLSYFLWSTAPDDQLLSLAWRHQLREPGVLAAQAKRMIDDRRANAFVENFAGQWLTLRKLDKFAPNEAMFPMWNEEIRELARRETYTFFAGVMRNNLSVLRLLDADFTYLNEKLAKFYGIPGIEGDQFRKVSLAGHNRRGILTHASVLAVTSNPTRTSPVKRGKWILDNLLNTPPPPAPPGVPELDKNEVTGTLRQRVEMHRADPACASCHKLMDPLGLALENYDAVGRWRTRDAGEAIDASGEMPTGEKIKNAGDLIRIMREKNTEKFVRCLIEKMMTFSLGRGLEYYDRCAVDKIYSKLQSDDFRFGSLVTEIVLSNPFQRKGVRDDLESFEE